jgi:hypothetical protein
MKKIIILLAVLAFLPLTQAAAQSQGGFDIFSFDVGYVSGYNVGTGTVTNDSAFGLNLAVGDKLFAGVTRLATANYLLISLKYQLLEQLRAQISVGTVATNGAAGLGFEYIPFTRKYGNSLSTDFKLLVQYFFTTTAAADVYNGTLFFGVSLGIGV